MTTYPNIHPSHEWCGGLLNQCVRCEAWHGKEASYFPCDPSKLAGKTESCCECGEDYSRSDLIAGHIYCQRCRVAEEARKAARGRPTHLLARLEAAGIAKPPKWLGSSLCYLTAMGSMAYGCNEDDSDLDVYGFCVPPKEDVFPHLRGEVMGFGRQLKRFEQYQEHHLMDRSARGGKGQEYDLSVYSIVKLFQLAMENNPNIVDSLFTARECVIYSTPVGEMVRERRRAFLHKGCWHKFRGYAYSQIAKLDGKKPEPGSRRAEYIAKYGFDVKYAVHLVRLILECEQALVEGDIDLRRHSDLLRAVRRGEWTRPQVLDWFYDKERTLEPLYHSSKALPYKPDEGAIKTLLLECLEHHYGSLGNTLVVPGKAEQALKDIRAIIERATA